MSLEIRRFAPGADLAPFVKFYYSVRVGDRAPVGAPNHPQGGVDLIFALRGRSRFSSAGGPPVSLGGTFLLPLQEHPFEVDLEPGVHHLCVSFVAEGFARFFPLSLEGLVDTGVEIGPELGRDAADLPEQLDEAPDDRSRVSLLESFLRRRLIEREGVRDPIGERWSEVRRRRGALQLGAIAELAEVSPRTVQRWARRTLGMGPKRYARIVRFNAALDLERALPQLDWHDVIYRAGYYDQSHFIGEFRRFTGRTPTEFLRGDTRLSEFYTAPEATRLRLEVGTGASAIRAAGEARSRASE